MNWFVYIIRCQNNSLYTGVTTDVDRRFKEHAEQDNKCAKYLRGKAPLELACSFKVERKQKAYQLEYHIKRLSKQEKEDIVKTKALPIDWKSKTDS